MLKIAICDDEQASQEEIKTKLQEFSRKYGHELEIECFSTGEELLKAPFTYEILFLDIQLEDGNDGISIGQRFRERNNNALFILSTYVLDRHREGYKAGVHRYLEKPIKQEELNEALLSALPRPSSKINIRFRTDTWMVDTNDILYIESYDKRRYVHTKTEVLITLEKLEQLEQRLPSRMFYRPQLRFLVNVEYVQKADRHLLIMQDGRKITFTKGSYAEFNRQLMMYLREKK